VYATVSHIETYHPARAPFTNNTKPSATQVAGVISDVEADVHVALVAAGYAVPVSPAASDAFLFLRSCVARIAADRVERIAPSSPDVAQYARMAEAAWKALNADDLELPGVDKDSDQTRVRFSRPVPTALFTRDMDL
jgi:hypothetical protein